MTPRERAAAYNDSTFGRRFPASQLKADDRWVSGVWVLGNNYASKTGYYGSFPPALLPRLETLFPDVALCSRLHLFSGSLGVETPGLLFDLRHGPDMHAHRLSTYFGTTTKFPQVIADPPYTAEDAHRYGTPMVDRRKVLHEVAAVTRPGGSLVWLDTVLPMFTKREWHWWGTIAIIRSTNHRVRAVQLFERVATC